MSVVKPIPGFVGYAATDGGIILTYWRRVNVGADVIAEAPESTGAFDGLGLDGAP